jgi:hypothetical protein
VPTAEATAMEAAGHAAAEVRSAYAAMVEASTHAVTEPVAKFAVLAIVGSINSVWQVSVVAVVIGGIGVARKGTAVSRIVYIPRRSSVPVGVGLRSSRLRSSKASHGQPNTAGQQGGFNREFAAGHRSLLRGIAPFSFDLF